MISFLDLLLYHFKWYRQKRGGVWYQVWELPYHQGGFEFWVREEHFYSSIPKKVLEIEIYQGTPLYTKHTYPGKQFEDDLKEAQEALKKSP